MTVASCDAAPFFDLYQRVSQLADAKLNRITCDGECQRFLLELYRAWDCKQIAGSDRHEVDVRVAKRLYCATDRPAGGTSPPTGAPDFPPPGGSVGHEVHSGAGVSGVNIEVGGPLPIPCGIDDARTFQLKYHQACPGCPGGQPNFEEANRGCDQQVDDLMATFRCAESCEMREEVVWRKWGCDGMYASVELAVKLSCHQPAAR